jgi:Fe-Mn family superoxide dismutase
MFKLPDLPYSYDALAPAISDATMRVHHDKHHAKYVATMNELLANVANAPSSLEAVVVQATTSGNVKLANNAGQAWNHGFFWESMSPKGGQPSGALAGAIDQAFGGFEKFSETFVKEGVGHFGSGWVWLASRGGKLSVVSTHDGKTLLPEADAAPILVCDLWEHAYYLDHKNDREGFLKAWVAKLADWSFAAAQFSAAQGSGQGYRYPTPTDKAA